MKAVIDSGGLLLALVFAGVAGFFVIGRGIPAMLEVTAWALGMMP